MIITPKAEYENLSLGSDKRVSLKCEDCGKVRKTTFNNYNNSQKKRNYDGKTPCNKCNAIFYGKKNKGKPNPNKGKPRPELTGEKSPCWKGGRWISSDGYWMIKTDNPKAKNKWEKYKKEHLIIAEQKLGRKLKKNEVVHHIDGNKLNNDIDNLDVLSNESKHREAHNSLNEIATELFQQGYIKYKDGKYYKGKDL